MKRTVNLLRQLNGATAVICCHIIRQFCCTALPMSLPLERMKKMKRPKTDKTTEWKAPVMSKRRVDDSLWNAKVSITSQSSCSQLKLPDDFSVRRRPYINLYRCSYKQYFRRLIITENASPVQTSKKWSYERNVISKLSIFNWSPHLMARSITISLPPPAIRWKLNANVAHLPNGLNIKCMYVRLGAGGGGDGGGYYEFWCATPHEKISTKIFEMSSLLDNISFGNWQRIFNGNFLPSLPKCQWQHCEE